MSSRQFPLLFPFIGALLFIVAWIGYASVYVVEPGYAALHFRLGRFIECNESSGYYLKIPAIDTVVYINNRIGKSVIETTALSRDLQFLSIGVAINYRIQDVRQLYQAVGTQFEQVIIDPFAQESIKAVVAQYTAEDLIQFRHNAKEKVFAELKERLLSMYIELIDFNFVHSDFSAEFIKAVEDKQIAEQRAKMAKNLTEKVKEEALQIQEKAKAEAYALQAQKDAVTPELIELKKVEAAMKAIEKWDGVLPRVSSGTVPLISLDSLR